MDGRSFLPLARATHPWRETLLYEYYWERNFPQTPTIHALRGARYKYIRYYGIWDTDELYDLREDPLETRNLVRDPRIATSSTAERGAVRNAGATEGLYIPLSPGPWRAEPPAARRREVGGVPTILLGAGSAMSANRSVVQGSCRLVACRSHSL